MGCRCNERRVQLREAAQAALRRDLSRTAEHLTAARRSLKQDFDAVTRDRLERLRGAASRRGT
jgi:hypothetical protein